MRVELASLEAGSLATTEALDLDQAERRTSGGSAPCFHCGSPCGNGDVQVVDADGGTKQFCCGGCRTVYEILSENGLKDFYTLSVNAGVRVKKATPPERFAFLDEGAVRERLVDYADERLTKVTFQVPAIHCIACVWLLENLCRLKHGIGQSRVNYARKELQVDFDPRRVKLSEVAGLLAVLGYEPELRLSDLEGKVESRGIRKLWLQIGVAGFAFGNNMLFSIAVYLGLDALNGPALKTLVGYISMLLAIPVVVYSAQDYWKTAVASLRRRMLNIEVPIAAGIVAIFAQSAYEVISGRGEGYFDSLAGLLFFLLCGKLFQQKTFARLNFDRDYKSFFPLSVTRKAGNREENVSLSAVKAGDRLLVRNGELIPADATLVHGQALIDYSFVTGESQPVEKAVGEHLYAGGRQMGGCLEIQTTKNVSQSYLTSLWNQEAFRKQKASTLETLTNTYSQRFTKLVLGIALCAAAYWWVQSPGIAVKAFTSVLIVACPCALALAAPFTLGTSLRALGRSGVFVKSGEVIEALAQVDTIVFDKTGTLTAAGAGNIEFKGERLTPAEEGWVRTMTRHSTHPYAVKIAETLGRDQEAEGVRSFVETPGGGMEGTVGGHELWLGSAAWLATRGASVTERSERGSRVHVAIDGRYRGTFVLTSAVRPESDAMLRKLAASYQLSLLSGDNEAEREAFAKIFGDGARLKFNQTPEGKLKQVEELQQSGRKVMMVGDGLNDAGALRQSGVGVAVVEKVTAFSPASDVIMHAAMLPRLGSVLKFSRDTVKVVRLSFGISAVYNAVGIAIAASGKLAPIVCAILMPLSSITVVAFACAASEFYARRSELTGKA